jgi:hypothetical protein
VTKDEKTLELIQRAVACFKKLPPPAGISDAVAIKEYYDIFDGPVRWKTGIRTPQETLAPPRKLNLSFKIREREKPLATTRMT